MAVRGMSLPTVTGSLPPAALRGQGQVKAETETHSSTRGSHAAGRDPATGPGPFASHAPEQEAEIRNWNRDSPRVHVYMGRGSNLPHKGLPSYCYV